MPLRCTFCKSRSARERSHSGNLARRMPRSPRPLKVKAAEMPGHVNNFANEKQAGVFA